MELVCEMSSHGLQSNWIDRQLAFRLRSCRCLVKKIITDSTIPKHILFHFLFLSKRSQKNLAWFMQRFFSKGMINSTKLFLKLLWKKEMNWLKYFQLIIPRCIKRTWLNFLAKIKKSFVNLAQMWKNLLFKYFKACKYISYFLNEYQTFFRFLKYFTTLWY